MNVKNPQSNDMSYKYDRDHDVLHIYFGEPTVSYAEEIIPGLYIRFSNKDDSITGIIILDYSQRTSSNIQKSVPLNIDFALIDNDLMQ